MEIKEITFDTIYPVWKDYLWPGRVTKIKPVSSIMFLGGIDISIYDIAEPTFWGVYENDKLLGVNSGFATDKTLYRSRGLYVFPEYRGQGVTKLLFAALENKAIEEGKKQLWSMPRKGSEYAYLKFGFIQVSDWFDENVEFGPNCYVSKEIKT